MSPEDNYTLDYLEPVATMPRYSFKATKDDAGAKAIEELKALLKAVQDAKKKGKRVKVKAEVEGEGRTQEDFKDEKPTPLKFNPHAEAKLYGGEKKWRERAARGYDDERYLDQRFVPGEKYCLVKPTQPSPVEEGMFPTLPRYKKKINQVLTDNLFDREVQCQKRGSLDFTQLYKAKTGSEYVFKKKMAPKNKNYSFGFMLDNSGSMYTQRTLSVSRMLYALEELFKKTQAKLYYGLFQNVTVRMADPLNPRPAYEMANILLRTGLEPQLRGVALSSEKDVLNWFKVAEDYSYFPISPCALIHDPKDHELLYGENNDGEGLQSIIDWMEEDSSDHPRFIFMIGDGGIEPYDHEVIKKAHADLAKKHPNWKIVGVAIGDCYEEMERLYPDCLKLNDDGSDMPEKLFAFLSKAIKRG